MGDHGPDLRPRAAPDARYAITFSTRLAGHELHRVSSPSIRETIERPPEIMDRYGELHWSPYAKTQIGQQELEPLLWASAAAQPSTRLEHGWRLMSLTEDADGVTAQAEEPATGATETFRARCLVACDGGASGIRQRLGIRMSGRGRMRGNVSFYFRSLVFLQAHDRGLGNLYFVMAPDSFGVFTAIDGASLWNFQYYFLDPARETEDLDPAAILHRAVGRPFAFDLLGHDPLAPSSIRRPVLAQRGRPRVPRRRRRSSAGSDWRGGDEHWHRRRDGPGLEAGCGACVAGAAPGCWTATSPSASRSPGGTA